MSSDVDRELRLGVVLNGGVSLAVWIGGATHEIDRLRRSIAPDGAPYAAALVENHLTGARVDVIAGASAGGINGAVLAAAIQGTTKDGLKRFAAGDAPLRDMWLDVGDMARLLRSRRELDPPSLLRGDEYMLPALRRVMTPLAVPDSESTLDHPLYLYVTATDLRGEKPAVFSTDAGETFDEPDHRVVFRFCAKTTQIGDPPSTPAGLAEDEMAEDLPLDAANAGRLARAARASSSFPGAFPPHRARIRRASGAWDDAAQTLADSFLVDGGILDNQPLRPVLDRVSLLPVTRPWRRVILFVVPYVTRPALARDAPGGAARARPDTPGILEVVMAGGLARDLPKLEGLQRIETARLEGRGARLAPRLDSDDMEALLAQAPGLYGTYRRTQLREMARTIEEWRSSPPQEGTGPKGGGDGNPREASTIEDPEAALAGREKDLASLVPAEDWPTATSAWTDPGGAWTWGLSKAERFARVALEWLGDAPAAAAGPRLDNARARVSAIGAQVRAAMSERRAVFNRIARQYVGTQGARPSPAAAREAFVNSHAVVRGRLREIAGELMSALGLTAQVLDVPGGASPLLLRLMAVEVVSNAIAMREPPPPEFDFFRLTAQGGALGHSAVEPAAKLTGMQLGHFAAFLKRSWRANDWMWGRLDGARTLSLVLYGAGDDSAQQRERWLTRVQLQILKEELPAIATASDADVAAGFSATSGIALWREKYRRRLDDIARMPGAEGSGDIAPEDERMIREVFHQLRIDPAELVPEESSARAAVAVGTRAAAVASRALSGDASGLPSPVRGVVGTSRRATAVTDSLTQILSRWPPAGIAIALVVAALAGILASGGSLAAAWLVPILIALAVAAGWTGYGWLSSPPTWWRAIVLAAILAALIAVNVEVFEGDVGDWGDFATDWSQSGWAGVPAVAARVAAIAAAVAWIAYLVILVPAARRFARPARLALGLALIALLSTWLVRLGLDWIDDRLVSAEGGWERKMTSQRAVTALLIVGVATAILVALVDVGVTAWLAVRRWRRARQP